MKKNVLFNLIQDKIIYKHLILPGATKLQLLTHSGGKKYFKFELALEEELNFGKYTVESHHVSVFETASTKLDLKSKFHYTAYLVDHEGNPYQLHVYYDAKNKQVGRPQFYPIHPNPDFDTETLAEYQSAFDALALMYTENLVSFFRDKQDETLEEIDAKIENFDSQLSKLSIDLINNKSKYLELLDQQIKLHQLKLLYSSNPKSIKTIKSLISLLENRKRGMEQVEDPVFLNSKAGDEVSLEEKDHEVQQETKEKTKRRKKHSKSNSETGLQKHSLFSVRANSKRQSKTVAQSSLSSLIVSFGHKLARLKLHSPIDANAIDDIEKLHADYMNKRWLYEFGGKKSTFSELAQFFALQEKIEEYGISKLQTLLLNQNYTLASRFDSYFSILPMSIVSYSLSQNRPELLALLFQKQRVDVGLNLFKVKDIQYTSIAEFCFNNTNSSNSYLEVLNMYVQKGGSLLSIDKSTGLPFAAILLMNHEHPLYPVLSQNPELTIHNKQFYTQLNHVLNLLISKNRFPDDIVEQVKLLIAQNRQKIILIDTTSSKTVSDWMGKIDSPLQSEEFSVGEEYVTRLLLDPEFTHLYKEVSTAYQAHVKKLSPLPIGRANSSELIDFDACKTELNFIEDFGEMPTYDEFKQDLIKKIVLKLELAEVRTELFEAQNTLKKISGSGKHQRDKRRELKKKVEEISRRNKELEKELDSQLVKAEALHQLSDFRPIVNQFIEIMAQLGTAPHLPDESIEEHDQLVLSEESNVIIGSMLEFVFEFVELGSESEGVEPESTPKNEDDSSQETSVNMGFTS